MPDDAEAGGAAEGVGAGAAAGTEVRVAAGLRFAVPWR